MVQQMLERNLQVLVSRQGGPDAILHFGRKTTEQLEIELYFGNNGYFATLEPTQDNRLMFSKESFWWNMSGEREIGSGDCVTYSFHLNILMKAQQQPHPNELSDVALDMKSHYMAP
ncbi:hypothetical protein [Nostoc sp. JL33]|uniref:hypothetical protein n=1 Tax=Nostoc sp. JL33 TaxID=2815396 RepID=UPI0025E81309|nr:hypothetical protein [Nostoc sp. JL33]